MQSYSYYDGSAVEEVRAEGSDGQGLSYLGRSLFLVETGAGHELANLCSLGAYEKAQSLRAKTSLYCAGVNRKGKKCQAMAMPGSQFCHAHTPAGPHAANVAHEVAKAWRVKRSSVQHYYRYCYYDY